MCVYVCTMDFVSAGKNALLLYVTVCEKARWRHRMKFHENCPPPPKWRAGCTPAAHYFTEFLLFRCKVHHFQNFCWVPDLVDTPNLSIQFLRPRQSGAHGTCHACHTLDTPLEVSTKLSAWVDVVGYSITKWNKVVWETREYISKVYVLKIITASPNLFERKTKKLPQKQSKTFTTLCKSFNICVAYWKGKFCHTSYVLPSDR